jgi:alpha-glucosidase
MWWHNAVIYQIYPRSFQDSNGDGIGDLPGITQRLDHIKRLDVDAIWLSPFYPSPNADFGYDISDYTDVHPEYGTLEDFDELVKAAKDRELKVLIDYVPAHTSTEHPWFRERPDFYFWADSPPNNWRATFGGTAWEKDEATGLYYLHSFFPEQADLNWRNPELRTEMTNVLKFWLDRGVDGFRLDAIDRILKDADLRDEPPATQPFVLPLEDEYGELEHLYSGNQPDVGLALTPIREAVKDAFLVGEAYLPTSSLEPYLETLDVAFAFEAMNAGPDTDRLRETIEAAHQTGKIGWVLSNHDFPRLASRFGENFRAACLLFLSLPGPVFMFQGDELGMPNGPGVDPPLDRAGRDQFRHPMPWDDSPTGGFTTGSPWLPPIDTNNRNVENQQRDPYSTLALFWRLIRTRHTFGPELRFLNAPKDTLVFERGGHQIAVNFGDEPFGIYRTGELIAQARPGDGADRAVLPPHGGWIALQR